MIKLDVIVKRYYGNSKIQDGTFSIRGGIHKVDDFHIEGRIIGGVMYTDNDLSR